jgi:hypothetical protein
MYAFHEKRVESDIMGLLNAKYVISHEGRVAADKNCPLRSLTMADNKSLHYQKKVAIGYT